MTSLVSAESVAIGHPDKAADQVSDAILDAYLTQDSEARVDITCVLSHETLFLAGEITSHATVDLEQVAKNVLVDIGYTSKQKGFDVQTCKTVLQISQQSTDIADAVLKDKTIQSGDAGIMVGYATDETDERMPLPTVLAHKLMHAIHTHRPTLGPDGKVLVGVSYNGICPLFVPFVTLSVQHEEELALQDVRKTVADIIFETIPSKFLNEKTEFLINPGGKFTKGGPSADTGLTGRKLMVDTYGTSAHHGGGAFSGKDPTKPDRSVSYFARYIAKNIIEAKLARRAEVTIHYAIGQQSPLALTINTFGTSPIASKELEKAIAQIFDLSIEGIITTLQLQRPIYKKTSWGGHFGRNDPTFTWEATDKVQQLLKYF